MAQSKTGKHIIQNSYGEGGGRTVSQVIHTFICDCGTSTFDIYSLYKIYHCIYHKLTPSFEEKHDKKFTF